MTNIEIEKRIQVLEAEVAVLKDKVAKVQNLDEPWYKQIPKFGGNPAYEEATKLAREYRKEQKKIEADK
ncbi:MAG: hypothetical protein AB7F88_17175 [Pyrinomonadaceae bacterium]